MLELGYCLTRIVKLCLVCDLVDMLVYKHCFVLRDVGVYLLGEILI